MVAHIHFWPGEISLLLQPTGFALDETSRLSDGDLNRLSDLTAGLIDPQTARLGPTGERLPVISPDGRSLLQTLSLKGWQPDLPAGDSQESLDILRQRVTVVTDAVRTLNALPQELASGGAGARQLPQYTLQAAAPNWLLYPVDE